MTRLCATVSVDLDDLWAYQRTRGDPAWRQFRSYLDIAIPRMLEALHQADCRATVFIVGADADRAGADRLLRPIAGAGHELGNHSFGHTCWLHRDDPAAIAADLARADRAIRAATGEAPVGFRGPGFTWSPQVLGVLADLGYLFDASLLPTFIGPLARRRLLRSSRLTATEQTLRAEVFGPWTNALRPVRPFRWRLEDGRTMLEIPVTTVPFIRVPFHQSYLVYLATCSRSVALGYFRAALAACRLGGVEPSVLLHPLDWLDGDEVPELGFFPGMSLGRKRKLSLLMESLRLLRESFTLVTMGALARRVIQNPDLPEESVPATPGPPSMEGKA